MAETTINIKQPYNGDRGTLLVNIAAHDLPSPAYAALEEVFASCEQWAEKWLKITTGSDGEMRPWWEVPIAESNIPTRAKTALTRHFGRNAVVGDVLMACNFATENLTEQVKQFGYASEVDLDEWMEAQIRETGLSLDDAAEAIGDDEDDE